LLCFDVRRNRKRVALAGVREKGVISLILSWRGQGSGASAQAVAAKGPNSALHLHVAGIDSSDPAGYTTVDWFQSEDLRLGDRIEVRIVSAGAATPRPEASPPSHHLYASAM